MKHVLKLLMVFVIGGVFTNCDPAMRVELVNLTGDEVDFQEEDLRCRTIFSEVEENESFNNDIRLQSGAGKSYTHYYGIGGWNEENQDKLEGFLDSMMMHQLGREVISHSELTEFGNSLMIYTFRYK